MAFEFGNTAGLIRGMSRTTEYRSWIDMKSRCLNKNNRFYKIYGGRGIKIYPSWLESFEAFLAHVGPKPTPAHTIDRYPDNNGNYVPGNVRWATVRQQINNRRSTRTVKINGVDIPLSEACEMLGVKRKLVFSRVDRGWAPERAIRTPALWHRT